MNSTLTATHIGCINLPQQHIWSNRSHLQEDKEHGSTECLRCRAHCSERECKANFAYQIQATELKVETFSATMFFHTDSHAIRDRAYRPKSRYMDPKIHLLKDLVLTGELKIIHIRSEANPDQGCQWADYDEAESAYSMRRRSSMRLSGSR